MYYNRFRYYSPETGNYLSQDPIRLAGNNPTIYGYVFDTNGWIDEFGLSRSKIDSSKLTKEQREALVSKRPNRYRKGTVEKVWENAKDPITGKVYDPNTGNELSWDKTKSRQGQWDMGHLQGKSYDDLKTKFVNGDLTYQEFLDEYNNPKNYHPEDMGSNRSNKHTH